MNRAYSRLSPAWRHQYSQYIRKSSGYSQRYALPSLPVPPLSQTLKLFQRTVTPLLTQEELDSTIKLIADFAKPGGVGESLQQKLVARAQLHRNWLEQWWLDAAYLTFREPVVIHSNPSMTISEPQNAQEEKQAWRAAAISIGALKYHQQIVKTEIPIEYSKDSPFCMAQFERIFAHSRIPVAGTDSLVSHPESKHIVVICKGQFFIVNVFLPNTDRLISVADLEAQLQHIISTTSQISTKQHSIGIFTSESRDNWTKIHQKLKLNANNAKNLEEINSGLFVVCLDEESGEGGSERLSMSLHGNGFNVNSSNRWFDKMQFAVANNGQAFINLEHSPLDAPPAIMMLESAVAFSRDEALKDNHKSSFSSSPRSLCWSSYSDIDLDIAAAESNLKKQIDNLIVREFDFPNFGRDLFKSLKLSPDASFQVALQAAYYNCHGHNCGTYETGSTRKFHHGRTDTIRSASNESLEFSKALLNSSLSNKEKLAKFKAAAQSHAQYTQLVMDGFGVDRHLLGLRLIAAQEQQTPHALFQERAYRHSSHWALSTSNISMAINRTPVFGPVVNDGYGLCYNLKPNQIYAGMSQFRNSSNKAVNVNDLDQSLRQTLLQIQSLSI